MTRIKPRLAVAAAVAIAATALASSGAAATPVHHNHGHSDPTVTIYLTRHGQTILNTVERVQGWTDSPLVVGTNADGSVLDARILPTTVGKNLRAREGKMDAAYSADMKRHFETATYILKGAQQQYLPITQDSRLREINFGRYEGATNKEMWTDIIEHLGYTVNHDAAATAPVDSTGQNGGWQTMQAIAAKEKGTEAMMAAMKELAEEPIEGSHISLPAEDCSDVSTRMMSALNEIAKRAAREHDDRVLVVSSGLSITCAIDSLGTTVNGGISNVAVSKLQYKKGKWTVLSVADKSYGQ